LLKLGFDALDTERNLLVLASPRAKKIQADDLPLENYYLATLKEMELFKEDLTYGLKRRLRVDEHDKPGKRAK
jgi:hypothetical protein